MPQFFTAAVERSTAQDSAVAAAQSDRIHALRLKPGDQPLVDQPRKNHHNDIERCLIRDPDAVDFADRDSQFLLQFVDGLPSAVHHDRWFGQNAQRRAQGGVEIRLIEEGASDFDQPHIFNTLSAKPHRFLVVEHQVHILQRLAGSPFAKVVDRRSQNKR